MLYLIDVLIRVGGTFKILKDITKNELKYCHRPNELSSTRNVEESSGADVITATGCQRTTPVMLLPEKPHHSGVACCDVNSHPTVKVIKAI